MKNLLTTLFIFISVLAFCQGPQPESLQGSPYHNGIMVATLRVYDENIGDTVNLYTHVKLDSLIAGNVLRSSDSLFYRQCPACPYNFVTKIDTSNVNERDSTFWSRDVINGYVFPKTLTDKVGINTNTPTSELTVNGIVNINRGQKNTFISGGNYTYNSFLGQNTAVGFEALVSLQNLAHSNSAFGASAGRNITSGFSNTLLGTNSGFSLTTGSENFFAGVRAGYSTTTGSYNFFLGGDTGYSNTTGAGNVFQGSGAGNSNTTGNGNIYQGASAGFISTVANYNTSSGYYSAFHLTGEINTAIGAYSMRDGGAAYNSTAIGAYSGYGATGYKNILIGYQAGYSESGNERLVIANSDIDNFIEGSMSADTLRLNSTLSVRDLIGTATSIGGWTAGNRATTIPFSSIDTSFTNELGTFTFSNDSLFYQQCDLCSNDFKGKIIHPTADGSETIIDSGSDISVTGSGTSASHYVVNNTAPESTNTTDSGTIDFTQTGDNITATVVDGSITPTKLDRTYLENEIDGDTTNEIQTIDTFQIVANKLRASLDLDGQPTKEVDLAPYLDNTDSQNINGSGFNSGNGNLTVGITGGTSQTVNLDGRYLTSFSEIDGDTTNEIQRLDSFLIIANKLYASLTKDGVNASFVDLIPYLDNTDAQTVDSFYLVGNILRIKLQNSAVKTVDLSSINTDSQNISGSSFNTVNGNITIGISGGSSQTFSLDGRYLTSQLWATTVDSLYPSTLTKLVGIGKNNPKAVLDVRKVGNNDIFRVGSPFSDSDFISGILTNKNNETVISKLKNLNIGKNGISPYIEIGEFSDLLQNATKKFTTVFSNSTHVGGLFENRMDYPAWRITAGNTGVLSIDLISKGFYDVNGMTYPQGNVYIHFYSNLNSAVATCRLKDRLGVWRDYSSSLKKYNYGSNGETYFDLEFTISPGFNYATEIEITVTAGASNVWITGVKWFSSVETAEGSYVKNFGTQANTYSNLAFRNDGYTLTNLINRNGTSYFNAGNVAFGAVTAAAKVDINGNLKVATLTATPTSFGAWGAGNEATKIAFSAIDTSFVNELQTLSTLSKTGNTVTMALTNSPNAAFSVADGDSSSTNELQYVDSLSFSTVNTIDASLSLSDSIKRINTERYEYVLNGAKMERDFINVYIGDDYTAPQTAESYLARTNNKVYRFNPDSVTLMGSASKIPNRYGLNGVISLQPTTDSIRITHYGKLLKVYGIGTGATVTVRSYTADSSFSYQFASATKTQVAYSNSTTVTGTVPNIDKLYTSTIKTTGSGLLIYGIAVEDYDNIIDQTNFTINVDSFYAARWDSVNWSTPVIVATILATSQSGIDSIIAHNNDGILLSDNETNIKRALAKDWSVARLTTEVNSTNVRVEKVTDLAIRPIGKEIKKIGINGNTLTVDNQSFSNYNIYNHSDTLHTAFRKITLDTSFLNIHGNKLDIEFIDANLGPVQFESYVGNTTDLSYFQLRDWYSKYGYQHPTKGNYIQFDSLGTTLTTRNFALNMGGSAGSSGQGLVSNGSGNAIWGTVDQSLSNEGSLSVSGSSPSDNSHYDLTSNTTGSTGMQMYEGTGINIKKDASGNLIFENTAPFSGAAAGGDLSGTYPNPTIASGKVTSTKIYDRTIQAIDIDHGVITAYEIAGLTITSAEIANNTITAGQIATDGVGAAEIAADAVGSSELASSGVSAGSYTNANITVDVDGRLTSASSGTDAVGVSSIATNNGITGGTITSTGTIGLTGNALGVHNLSSNGLMTRTSSGTVVARTVAAGNGISVTNGDGVSGSPTVTNTKIPNAIVIQDGYFADGASSNATISSVTNAVSCMLNVEVTGSLVDELTYQIELTGGGGSLKSGILDFSSLTNTRTQTVMYVGNISSYPIKFTVSNSSGSAALTTYATATCWQL